MYRSLRCNKLGGNWRTGTFSVPVKIHNRSAIAFLTLPFNLLMGILASSVRSRNLNTSIQISPLGYVHKLARAARPRLKRFIQFLTSTPTFMSHCGGRVSRHKASAVQDSGLIAPRVTDRGLSALTC